MKLKYRKYWFVSNRGLYNMLWFGLEVIFAYIPYQKPNITQLPIYLDSLNFGKINDIL